MLVTQWHLALLTPFFYTAVYYACRECNVSVIHSSLRSMHTTWWRHQMETFSALLALCAGNSPVTGELPAQRTVTRSFDVFFDRRLNQQLGKQWRRRWFKTPSRSLGRHCNDMTLLALVIIVSGYGLLPGGTKPLPDPILIYCHANWTMKNKLLLTWLSFNPSVYK